MLKLCFASCQCWPLPWKHSCLQFFQLIYVVSRKLRFIYVQHLYTLYMYRTGRETILLLLKASSPLQALLILTLKNQEWVVFPFLYWLLAAYSDPKCTDKSCRASGSAANPLCLLSSFWKKSGLVKTTQSPGCWSTLRKWEMIWCWHLKCSVQAARLQPAPMEAPEPTYLTKQYWKLVHRKAYNEIRALARI